MHACGILYHVVPRAVQRVVGGASYCKDVFNRCKIRVYCQTTRAPIKQKQSLLKQFQTIKSQYEDYILLFQVGDFYELYGSDANAVADKTSLRIAKHANSGVLMAGFPKRSLNEWSKVLVKAGFQLAICNQASGSYEEGSRLMKREVVKLVTPGTLLEPLDQHANYLLSIFPGPSHLLGLAWIDLSTAAFQISSTITDNVDEEVERISPAEIILPENEYDQLQSSSGQSPLECCTTLQEYHLTAIPDQWYSEDVTGKMHLSYLLSGSQFSHVEKMASSGLLNFILHTQKDIVPHLCNPVRYQRNRHLSIDANTRRALEIITPVQGNTRKSTLLGSIDKTVTAGGARLLKNRITAPFTDLDEINQELNCVQAFYDEPVQSDNLQLQLKSCADLERIIQKIAVDTVTPYDLQMMVITFKAIGSIKEIMKREFSKIANDFSDMESFSELVTELENAIGNYSTVRSIKSGYSGKIDDLRDELKDNYKQAEDLCGEIQGQYSLTKISVVDHRHYLRLFEVPKTQTAKADNCSELVRIEQTAGKTRYSHIKLQQLNSEYQKLQEQHEAAQNTAFKDLCAKIMNQADTITGCAQTISRLDVAVSLGLIARSKSYCKPLMSTEPVFHIKAGRHAVVESMQQDNFVSNDCDLNETKLWLVTGPNMGGKSTFLRQNALITILAQMGSFVPAEEATIGVVDRLFARIGAGDNVVKHMSTFHMEMSETAHIISHATPHSLVIIDEIGRGTSAMEGLSVAWAVMEHLHNVIGCRTLLATHYHQLESLAPSLSHAACYKLVAERMENDIMFTYRIEPGVSQSMFAIDVAQLCGVPNSIITRAQDVLASLGTSTTAPVVSISSAPPPAPVPAGDACTVMTPTLSPAEEECLHILRRAHPDKLNPREALDLIYNLKSILSRQD